MKVKVGKRGTIVIPKNIRDNINLEEGDVLKVKEVDKGIMLERDDRWRKFHGCVKGTTAEEIEKEFDEAEQSWEKRLRK